MDKIIRLNLKNKFDRILILFLWRKMHFSDKKVLCEGEPCFSETAFLETVFCD